MAKNDFGRVIEERRHALSLAQQTVAKKINVAQNYISYLERGMRHPSYKVIEELSAVLQLDFQGLYLLANPHVRTLLDKPKPVISSLSIWQTFIRDPVLQSQQGLSKVEQEVLAQLVKAESASSMADVRKVIRALRK